MFFLQSCLPTVSFNPCVTLISMAPVISCFTKGVPRFSLTFEVEGHWLVSRQVPCKTEGRRPEPLGGSGACSPGKCLELKSPRSAFSCNVIKKSSFCNQLYLT